MIKPVCGIKLTKLKLKNKLKARVWITRGPQGKPSRRSRLGWLSVKSMIKSSV